MAEVDFIRIFNQIYLALHLYLFPFTYIVRNALQPNSPNTHFIV